MHIKQCTDTSKFILAAYFQLLFKNSCILGDTCRRQHQIDALFTKSPAVFTRLYISNLLQTQTLHKLFSGKELLIKLLTTHWEPKWLYVQQTIVLQSLRKDLYLYNLSQVCPIALFFLYYCIYLRGNGLKTLSIFNFDNFQKTKRS